MSTTFAMDTNDRVSNYVRQNGHGRPTPKQKRRLTHKLNRSNKLRREAMGRHPAGKALIEKVVETCKTCGVPVNGEQKCQTKNGTDAPKMHADRARKLDS